MNGNMSLGMGALSIQTTAQTREKTDVTRRMGTSLSFCYLLSLLSPTPTLFSPQGHCPSSASYHHIMFLFISGDHGAVPGLGRWALFSPLSLPSIFAFPSVSSCLVSAWLGMASWDSRASLQLCQYQLPCIPLCEAVSPAMPLSLSFSLKGSGS